MSEFPDYITVQEACAIVGGVTKPINKGTFYRNPELRALIEHPTPNTSRVRRGKLIEALNGNGEAK
jgi:hypothetical protein